MTTSVCQPGVPPQLCHSADYSLDSPPQPAPRTPQASMQPAGAQHNASAVDTFGLISYPSGIAAALREVKQWQSLVGKITAVAGKWVDAATGVFSVYDAASKEIAQGGVPGKYTMVAITAAVSKNVLSAGVSLGVSAFMASLAASAPAMAFTAGTAALVVAGTYGTGKAVDWIASKYTIGPAS